jgi:hypothetical protein
MYGVLGIYPRFETSGMLINVTPASVTVLFLPILRCLDSYFQKEIFSLCPTLTLRRLGIASPKEATEALVEAL